MSQSSWKETNSRDKTFTLGLNTSITAKDITTSGTLQANKIDANEFIGTGVVDSSSSLGRVNDGSGEIIASAFAIKNYIKNNYANHNLGDQSGHWIAHNEILYPSEARDNAGVSKSYGWKLGAYDQKNDTTIGTLHFVSNVSFDHTIRAVGASFEKLGGLNGTPLEIVDNISFTGTIGHEGGVGNALEVTTDLSVNGAFRVSDASFSRVGELVSGSNVEFVSDVSFSGTIGHAGGVGNALEVTTDLSVNGAFRVSDASFARVGALVSESNVEFVSDVSFSGTIGHTNGVGTALEVTSDLSVNGPFRVSDASFSRVGELVYGSNVEFVSDVSFDGSIRAVDASFTGKVDIQSLGGNAIVSSIPNGGGGANDKVASISAIKDYFDVVLDISAFFVIDGDILRPTRESSGNKIGGYRNDDGNSALAFVSDVSFHGSIHAGDASFVRIGATTDGSGITFVNDISADSNLYVGADVSLSQKLYVVGDISADSNLYVGADVSFNAHLSAVDASFQNNVDISGKLVVDGDVSFNAHLSAMDASFHKDVTVVGDLYVDGSFNFGEVIKNITTVNNELLISTQVDISNHGTGPALSVTQYGDGDGDKLAVFDAGEQGVAFEIMYDGDSVFHKDVSFQNNVDISGKLVVKDDVSFNAHLSAMDASFQNLDVSGNIKLTGSVEAGKDTETTSFFGKSLIGSWSNSGGNALNDFAIFSHHDRQNEKDFAVMASAGGTTYLNAKAGNMIRFRIDNANKMTMDANGNLGIPTPISTTDYTAKLAVNGGLYVDGAQGIRLPRTFNLDPGERTWRITQSSDSPGGTVNDLMFHYILEGNVETGKIRFKRGGGSIISSGTVTANGTVLTSDDRIKENEKLIVNATETLSKLTPQIYDKYQSMDLSGSSTIESGLIAQEVYYNAPELRHLVVVGKDYDASGNEYTQTPEEMDLSGVDIANDPDYGSHGWSKTEQSGLHYNGLIPYLIKSIQELTERLAALENKQ